MKLIAFDLGNVLVKVDIHKFCEEFNSNNYLRASGTGFSFLENLQPYQDVGLTTVRKQLKVLFQDLSEKNINKLVNAWESTLELHPQMVDSFNELVNSNYTIAILSNIGFEHKNLLKKIWPELYDKTIHHFSCDVGTRKPHKLYFQSFLMEYPWFKNCFYVDDRLENLDMAEQMGFYTYHFDLEKSSNKEINNLKERIKNI